MEQIITIDQKMRDTGTLFVQAIKKLHLKPNTTEIDEILIVLDELSIRLGYTIGCYQVDYRYASFFSLYARRINANERVYPRDIDLDEPTDIEKQLFCELPRPFEYKENMIIVGPQKYDLEEYLPCIFDYVRAPETIAGYWQLYLLYVADDYFPRTWHACYRRKDRIFHLKDLETIRYIVCDELRNESILPTVEIGIDKAIVTCCYFNLWSGLCRETVHITRDNTSYGFNTETEVLVPYDCGMTL